MIYGKRIGSLLLAALLAGTVALTGCGKENGDIAQPSEENPIQQVENTQEEPVEEFTEEPGIPLATKYIILSYPAELENEVTVQYEDLKDGQQIIFTTNFTDESLELFRFSLSKTAAEGYELGILTDDEAGELHVCVDVKEYDNGNWTPEDYTKLTAMQERVNDIIVQFHEDPRFTPVR